MRFVKKFTRLDFQTKILHTKSELIMTIFTENKTSWMH